MLKDRTAGISISILVFVLITLALSAIVLLVFVDDSKEEETIRSVGGVRKAHSDKVEAEFFVSQLVENTLEEIDEWDEDNFRGNLSINAENIGDVEEEQGTIIEMARKRIVNDKYELDRNNMLVINDFNFRIGTVVKTLTRKKLLFIPVPFTEETSKEEAMVVIYRTELEVELPQNIEDS